MHLLYVILFFISGIGLTVLGVWLCVKEWETFSKWHNDSWTIGQIRGLGIGVIIIGLILILQSFN